MTALATPIDGRLFGSQAPDREKLTLVLDAESNNSIRVVVNIPLANDSGPEGAALYEFGPRLIFHYAAKLNLEAERWELVRRLKQMYAPPDGAVLLADPPQNLTRRQVNGLLAPLAAQGASVYYRLIGTMLPEGIPANLVTLARDAALSAFKRSQVIAVTSGAPLFPWAFLYDDDGFKPTDLATLDPTRFWGFHHEIQDELAGTAKVIRVPDPPSIVTAISDDVDGGVHSQADHPLMMVGGVLKKQTAVELGTSLGSFPAHCLYFYGHADHCEHPVPASSWLKLRGVPLTVDELERVYKAPKFSENVVVVFLNGCRTAPLEEWNTGSVSGFLVGNGGDRVCCIASVAQVPEGFAAAFARHFWKVFLEDKKPIGTSILEARRAMLKPPSNNPLGLVYSLFGRVDTRICSRAGARSAP